MIWRWRILRSLPPQHPAEGARGTRLLAPGLGVIAGSVDIISFLGLARLALAMGVGGRLAIEDIADSRPSQTEPAV